MNCLQAAKIAIVGLEIADLAFDALKFCRFETWCDASNDPACDLVLQLENVLKATIEAVRPKVRAACRLDELARDANAVASLAQAAFEHVTNAELSADLPDVRRFTFVSKA